MGVHGTNVMHYCFHIHCSKRFAERTIPHIERPSVVQTIIKAHQQVVFQIMHVSYRVWCKTNWSSGQLIMAESAVAFKKILVTFQGRKKVLAILQEGIAFLRKEFYFTFGMGSSESIAIFQRYNEEFEDYVDVDSDSELFNKEKLQAVATHHSDVSLSLFLIICLPCYYYHTGTSISLCIAYLNWCMMSIYTRV